MGSEERLWLYLYQDYDERAASAHLDGLLAEVA